VRPVINSVARMSALPLTMLSSRLEHLVKTSLRALLMVMLSCCSGLAQPPTLTIDQAVQQALDRYPAVRSSLERVYAAAERHREGCDPAVILLSHTRGPVGYDAAQTATGQI